MIFLSRLSACQRGGSAHPARSRRSTRPTCSDTDGGRRCAETHRRPSTTPRGVHRHPTRRSRGQDVANRRLHSRSGTPGRALGGDAHYSRGSARPSARRTHGSARGADTRVRPYETDVGSRPMCRAARTRNPYQTRSVESNKHVRPANPGRKGRPVCRPNEIVPKTRDACPARCGEAAQPTSAGRRRARSGRR